MLANPFYGGWKWRVKGSVLNLDEGSEATGQDMKGTCKGKVKVKLLEKGRGVKKVLICS